MLVSGGPFAESESPRCHYQATEVLSLVIIIAENCLYEASVCTIVMLVKMANLRCSESMLLILRVYLDLEYLLIIFQICKC